MTGCATPGCSNEGRYIVDDGTRSCGIHVGRRVAIRLTDVPALLRATGRYMHHTVWANDFPNAKPTVEFRDRFEELSGWRWGIPSSREDGES